MKDLRIYSFPISGGAFINQIAFSIEVGKAMDIAMMNRNPDIMLGNSGGNVTSYVSMAGNFQEEGILRFSRNIDSTMFARTWTKNTFLPSLWVGLMKGSLYREGCGARDLFHSVYNDKTIQDIEIWTGTYSIDDRKAQLFCNRRKDNSLLTCRHSLFYDTSDGIYLNGDVSKIADVSLASASIPMIVPSVKICDKRYSDGGVMFSSPLTPLKENIINVVNGNIELNKGLIYNALDDEISKSEINTVNNNTVYNIFDDRLYELSDQRKMNSKKLVQKKEVQDYENKRRLRLFYFNSYNIDSYKEGCKTGDLGEGKEAIEQMIHMACLEDNRTAINMLRELNDNVTHSFIPSMNTKLLSDLLLKLESHEHYVIIFIPDRDLTVNITRFNGDCLVEKIQEAIGQYSVHVYASN